MLSVLQINPLESVGRHGAYMKRNEEDLARLVRSKWRKTPEDTVSTGAPKRTDSRMRSGKTRSFRKKVSLRKHGARHRKT